MNQREKPQITGLLDQHGNRLIEVKTSAGELYLSMSDVVEPAKAAPKLADLGIVLIAGKRRTAFFERLSEVEEFQPVHIIDSVGWHQTTFALGDGTQIRPDGSSPLRSQLKPEFDKWSTAGTLKQWRAGVAQPLTGQSIAMLTLMLPFAPPIMRFVDCWTNPGFELVGPKATGKSTLLMAASSVYGGIGGTSGGRYYETWNVTSAGMETLAQRHCDCLLILDELNTLTAGSTPGPKRHAYNGIVFNMGSGIDKTKFGEKRNAQRFLCYLSSSNTPLAQELAGGAADVVSAAADRLLTISVDAGRGLGVFDFVPDEFRSSKDLIDSVKSAASKNHGVAIRAYLEKLVQDLADDQDRLAERIRGWVRQFELRALTGADSGTQNRTASMFALVYAAGRLAQDYGVVPKRWECGPAVLTCYQRHVAEKAVALGGALERIRAYAARTDVIQGRGARDIDVKSFRASAGLVLGQGAGDEIVVDPRAFRARVSDSLALIKALDRLGAVDRDGDTYQTKRTIGDRSIRVYAFKLKL